MLAVKYSHMQLGEVDRLAAGAIYVTLQIILKSTVQSSVSTVAGRGTKVLNATALTHPQAEVFLGQTGEVRDKVIQEIIRNTRTGEEGQGHDPTQETGEEAGVSPVEGDTPPPIPIKVIEEEMSIKGSPRRGMTLEQHQLV